MYGNLFGSQEAPCSSLAMQLVYSEMSATDISLFTITLRGKSHSILHTSTFSTSTLLGIATLGKIQWNQCLTVGSSDLAFTFGNRDVTIRQGI